MELIVSTHLGQGGHSDLVLKIPLLGLEVIADSYYFALALEERLGSCAEADVRGAVVALLEHWKAETLACDNGETIHLPFDFSDQYTGCLQVEAREADVLVSYGFSQIEGWRVDPLGPGLSFRAVQDFKARPRRSITVPRQAFLLALDRAIAGVVQEGARLH